MALRRGFKWDAANSRLDIYVDGTVAARLNDTGSYLTVPAGGLTVTAGGVTVTAGGLQVVAGTLNIDGIADFALDVKFNSTITAGADGVGTDGEQLTSGGAAAECDWAAAASLLKFKNILGIRNDADKVLEQIVNTPVYDFRYKRSNGGEHVMSTGDHDTVYTGVVSEDAPWAMHFKGTILNPINTFGYTVLALKALVGRVEALEAAV